MLRRSFLGLFGAGAVAAPRALQTMGTKALDIQGLGTIGSMVSDMDDMVPYGPPNPARKKEWALKQLAKQAAKSLFEKETERSEFQIYNLTPDVAALKSVSMGHKMRMVRDEAYEKEQGKKLVKAQRIIAGIDFEGDDSW